MKETRLIVNADDLGMSRGITDGIILAHRYGIVTSASLMVNTPAAEYAVERLAKTPQLGVGVHLNVCAGAPVLPREKVPTLVGIDGKFHPPAVMIRKLWLWRVALSEIEAEFRAQLRWAKERGIAVTHADSHHHMHIYPAAVLPFVRALAAEGIECARTPRMGVWPRPSRFRSIGGPHEGGVCRRVAVQAYRGALRRTPFRKLRMPDARISFFSKDRRDPSALLKQWKVAIENLPSGTFELACHPGLFERGFSESDPILRQRENELQWLADRELRDLIDRRRIRLISYRDLVAPEQVPNIACKSNTNEMAVPS